MKKFYIHSMGCKSNQFEGSVIRDNLIKNGMEETQCLEKADFFILNSCTVTHKSDNEALYLLRNAKKKNQHIFNIITGCAAQIEKEKLLEYNFIDMVIGNDDKFNMFEIIESPKYKNCIVKDIMTQSKFNETMTDNFQKTRASLKIQDGCDNRCSYCIIPYARGKSRSAELDFVLKKINTFASNGFHEVVLTGIHIGQWGKDIGYKFIDLIKNIEENTSIERFRLGSLNPLEINDELLDYLSKSQKFCPHFHLSLQSACDKTLKSMNRFYKTEDYLLQIDKINNLFKLPFIGCDIITGFAGESEEDFLTTVSNLKKSGLSQIHTFPYSVRKGTIGATLAYQIPENVKQIRTDIVKEISKQKFNEFLNKNINKTYEVLVQKHKDKPSGSLKGITRNYITVVLDSKDDKLLNTIQYIKIIEIKNNKVYAKLI